MNRYQLNNNPHGVYIKPDGSRYDLLCVGNIRTPQGLNVGWFSFDTLDDCLAAWELTYSPESEAEGEQ